MMKTIKSKLVFSLLFFLISLILFNLTSCENIVQKDDGKKIEEEREEEAEEELEPPPAPDKGYLKLSVTQEEINNNARTILPEININTLTSFVLTGTKEGVDYTIGSWSSVSAVTAGNLELDLGTWNLTLTAKQDNGKIFTGTASNVQVQLGVVKPVSFLLSATNNQGGVSFTLNYVTSTPVTKVKYYLYNFSSSSESEADHGYLTPVSNSVSFIKDSVTSPLNPGTYRLQITFFSDDDENVIIGVYSEIVQIKGGFTSKGTNSVNLNQMWNITYNRDGGTPVGGAGLQETYSIYSGDINFPDLEKTGYNFVGWFKDAACTTGNEITKITEGSSGNIPVYAKFTPRNDTAYKVEHYKQNINDDNYVLENTDNLTGTTAWNTEASAKDTTTQTSDYYGFTAKTFSQSAIAADGSTIVKIYYDRNTYKITYNSGVSGQTIAVPSAQTGIRFGATVTPDFTTTVTRTGYTFAGWSDGTTTYTSGDTFEMPATNKMLTAQWNPNTNTQYKIKHMWQDTTGSTYTLHETETKTGITGEPTSAASYIKTNYTGFNTPSASSVTEEAIAADGTTEVEIRYTRKTYTLSYAMDGGSGTIASSTVRYEATVTPDFTTTVSKTGYTFAGWKNGSTTYTSGDTFPMPNNDVTLTAQWNPNTNTQYKIKHMWQDTTGSTYTLHETETKTGITGEPTSAASYIKTNYTGFNTPSASSVTEETIAADGSTVVEIKYDRKTATLSYNKNGGTGTFTSKTVRYDETVSVDFTTSTSKTGYTFAGWKNSVSNSTYTSSGTPTFTVTASMINAGTITLTAQWSPITYTISFTTNDGTIAASYTKPTSYTIESEDILLPTSSQISKTGYQFGGWYTNASFTNSSYTKISSGSYGNKTFYAKWTPITYSIDYVPNNGTFKTTYTKPTSYTVESPVTLPTASNITRAGYTFGGWYENSGCTGTNVTATSSTTTGNKTYYAKWTIDSYTITFNTNSGTFNGGYTKPSSYNINSADITLPTADNISRSGHTFGGWYTNSGLTGSAETKIDSGSTGNKTYYAKWLQVLTATSASAAATQIQNAEQGQTVKITGSFSVDDYTTIQNALIARSTPIGLDLSGLSMTNLPNGFINGCNKINYLKLPDSLTSIASNALLNTGNGSTFKLVIPKNVTTIGNRGTEANCYAVEVDSGNTSFKTIDGVLFSYDGKTLYTYPKYKTDANYEVPSGVTTIKESAMYSTKIQNLTLPSSLTLMEHAAMNNQYNLKSVTFNTLTNNLTIKDSVFQSDRNLATIEYKGSVSSWNSKVTCEVTSGTTSWINGCSVTQIKCTNGTIDVSTQTQ